MDIAKQVNENFQVEECLTDATIQECFKLRYQAFCIENKLPFKIDEYAKIETDQYDSRSKHALIKHRKSGANVATVRLILSRGDEKFPLENFDVLRRFDRDRDWIVDRSALAEISRFAISKSFRKRAEERDVMHGITPYVFESGDSDRRRSSEITLGLFHAVVKLSHTNGITHWYAMMELSLIRLLGQFGINFIAVGAPVEYYGLRQPCIAVVKDVLEGIYLFNPRIWQYITMSGRLYGDDYLYLESRQIASKQYAD